MERTKTRRHSGGQNLQAAYLRDLLFELVKLEFTSKYKASVIGVLWSFIRPLILLAVYTTVFGVMLEARWGISVSKTDYAMSLFLGLIVFQCFADTLTHASSVIVKNPNYVKKIVFPLSVLPIVSVLSAMIQAGVSLSVWFVVYLFLYGLPSVTVLWLPLPFLVLLPLLLGVSWLFSAVGVVFRDLEHVTGLICQALLFLSPIFYSLDTLPEKFQSVMRLNPLTTVIESLRSVMLFSQHPPFEMCFQTTLLLSCFMLLGLMTFYRCRPIFADLV